MIFLGLRMQGEDIFERTNGKFHCVDIFVCKGRIFLSVLIYAKSHLCTL